MHKQKLWGTTLLHCYLSLTALCLEQQPPFHRLTSSMAALLSLHQCLLLIAISCFIANVVQSDTYIIHMDTSAMPKVFTDHHSWYAATLSSLSTGSNPSSSPKLIYTYTSATHGFSAVLSPSEHDSIQKMPGFVYSIRDVALKPHSTHTPEFLGLNSNSGAWPQSSYGKDVIIGVVDSGVWPESESYKDHGMSEIPSRWKGKCVGGVSFNSSMCNRKLIGAHFFSKGITANRPDLNITGDSVRDTYGHGTHTSSTAAGNYVNGASFFGYGRGTIKGIAPRAHLAIYKALWDGHAYASDVIAAIDQAVKDGVDVLSISMSWTGPLYEDPIAIASYAAVKKGIFVATSAGNDGPYQYTVRNGAPWVLTVGAGTVDRKFSGTITLGNGVVVSGQSLFPGNISLHNVPLVYKNDCADDDELKKVGYKIVVCKGGFDDDTRQDQLFSTKAAGVAGAILIGETSLQQTELLQVSFPATLVDSKYAQPILDYVNKSSNLKASIDFHKTEVGSKPAPIVGEYSSRGPSHSCPSILKPDLIAPGTMVLASWPPIVSITFQPGSEDMFSPFNLATGTSMACPHAAGVAALLKAKHPQWSPAAIKSALITTAVPYDNTGKSIKMYADLPGWASASTPLDTGAGLINPNKAMNPGLVYDANADDYMSFLCSTNYTTNQIKMITRSSPLNCSNPSSDINYPSFIAFFNSTTSSPKHMITQEFRRTVTNVGDDISTYRAVLAHMDEIKLSISPKTLVFKHKYEKQSFTLTMKGPALMSNLEHNGSLSWVDDKGKYVVRSPIVVTRVNFDDIET